MKKCPYCAEEIQDEAVKCPYCRSDVSLVPGEHRTAGAGGAAGAGAGADPSPAPEAGAPTVGEGALRFTHSGFRYVLGYGPDYFGIWDREHAGGALVTFPRTDAGWNEAWNRFVGWEPRSVEVPQGGTPPPDVRRPMGTVRPLRTLGLWVAGLLGALMVLGLVQVAFRGMELSLLHRLRACRSCVDRGEIRASDNRLTSVSAIAGLVGIATIVVWLVWQHRAHSNLTPLGATSLRFTPGWAVGWWFIPFANVAMPYLTIRELYKASDPTAGAIDWKASRAPPLLGLWWGAFLLRGVLPLIGRSMTSARPTIDQLIARDPWLIASGLVEAAAAFLAIQLVRRIEARQTQKLERMSAWASGAW